ncbi:metallophosphoesterase [Streptomyces sp. NPDC005438]|uniref:metallophosphoesterase n=1 Tax=Streptomyces sp. NPDC005438 TaxID=3156880 RepID=UPI0033A3D580
MTLLLAQISDLHLDGTARTRHRVRRVVDHLASLPRAVDALLVTGDIADHGAEEEYREAARLLRLPFPVLTCPGNHDDRATYRRVLLGEAPDTGPAHRLHRLDGAAVLALDATLPGRNEGELTERTLAWADRELAQLPPGTLVLLAFHQPPVRLHHPLPDGSSLLHPERLASWMAGHPEVAGVLTGHAHTSAATVFASRPLVACPATTWTLRLPWEGDEPADLDQPPALAYHLLEPDGRLATHFRTVV